MVELSFVCADRPSIPGEGKGGLTRKVLAARREGGRGRGLPVLAGKRYPTGVSHMRGSGLGQLGLLLVEVAMVWFVSFKLR